MSRIALVLAAVLSLAIHSTGTVAAQNARVGEIEANAEAIKSLVVDMWNAIEHGELERYAAHLHPDFTSFGETDPYLNQGKEYEVRSVAGWMESSPGVHTEIHNPEVTARGDVAWITYYWTDAWTDQDGNRSGSAGKSTRIFVREHGHWLCIHGHYTLRPE